MKIISRVILVGSMLIPFIAQAQEVKLSKLDRDIIIKEVIRHFEDNPEKILQALSTQEKTPNKQTRNLTFQDAATVPWEGNPEGEFTILVFSDYGCSQCNAAEDVVRSVSTKRNDVLITYRDTPISSENAVSASLDLMTVFKSKGRDAWAKLRSGIRTYGVKPEGRIKALEEAGLIATSKTTSDIKVALLKNRELARRAGVQELPAVIIMRGEGVVPISGTITEELVLQAISLLAKK